MNPFIEIIKLTLPFIQEFGFNKDDVVNSIKLHKHVWIVCISVLILFCCMLYALDQANTRMIIQLEHEDRIEELQSQVLELEHRLALHDSYRGSNTSNTIENILQSTKQSDIGGITDAGETNTVVE